MISDGSKIYLTSTSGANGSVEVRSVESGRLLQRIENLRLACVSEDGQMISGLRGWSWHTIDVATGEDTGRDVTEMNEGRWYTCPTATSRDHRWLLQFHSLWNIEPLARPTRGMAFGRLRHLSLVP